MTKAKRFSLDELRLVGIVTGDDSPRAMLVDPPLVDPPRSGDHTPEMRLSIAFAMFFVLLGCETSRPPDLVALGCGKDTDCKGTRVCESNRCVEPATPPANALVPAIATPIPAFPAHAMAKLRVNSEPDGGPRSPCATRRRGRS